MTPIGGPAQAQTVTPTRAHHRSLIPLLVLAALYGAAVALYVTLAHQSPLPLLLPDETIYGTLARSIAGGGGPGPREVFDVHSSLYPYLIAPAWWEASGSAALADAQTIGAGLLCLTVVPVWLLARRYVGPWLALVPAVLVVSGTWSLTAAGLLTENAGLPLGAAALAATVAAVSLPGSRWGWVALAFAALATLARLQLVVLVPVIAAALVIDCARYRHAWRQRLAAHRTLAISSGGLTAFGLIAVLASPDSALGIYDRLNGAPATSDVAAALKDQLTALLAMTAVLPVVIVAAGCSRLESWRDDRIGPLLAVTAAAVVLFLVQSAWALSTFLTDGLVPWHIQRYVVYPVPLLLVATTVLVVEGRMRLREFAIAGMAGAFVLLFTPGVRDVQEERALFALQERVGTAIGSSAGLTLALVAALLVGVGLLITTSGVRGRPVVSLGVVSAAILATFLVQAQLLWPWQQRTTSGLARALPPDRSWIDATGRRDVATLLIVGGTARAELTQFFNREADRVYVPQGARAPRGSAEVCTWRANAAGVVTWGRRCGATPTSILLDDDFAKVRFREQRVVATQPGNGRLVDLPAIGPARSRLEAVLRVPCGPPRPTTERGGHGELGAPQASCQPVLAGAFWLDEPGVLVLRFRGGDRPYRVGIPPSRIETIRPYDTTTLRLPLTAGSSNFEARLEWQRAGPQYPALTGADLVRRGTPPENLLY